MNYPTRDEFEQLKEEVRKLREQQTEPIRITRLEIVQSDLSKRLGLVQEDVAILRFDVAALNVEMRGARADILQIKESQADLRDTFKEHGQCLKSIEEKQDAHSEILEKLVDFAELHDATLKEHTQVLKEHTRVLKEHAQRFDRIEATQTEHSSMLKEHGQMLREILVLLKQRPSE